MDTAWVLRLAVAGLVLMLLARAGLMAWRHRRVALAVWSRVRWQHVVGSLGLLSVVVTTLVTLIAFVPGAGWGLGSLIGLSGNAVFAPLEAATTNDQAAASGTGAAAWPGLLVAGGVVAFLSALLAMFPWLAYVEERVFREGLEDADLSRELWVALKFGLVHMVMLIPIGAALAIGVAGFAYGRIYRHAFARSRERARTDAGPFGVPVVVGPTVQQARNEAVLSATVWHATFNSLIVLTLLLGFVAGWLLA